MIYLLPFLLSLYFLIKFDFNKKKAGANFSYNLLLFILILIAGLRYKVGGDSQNYFNYFDKIPFLSTLPNYDFIDSPYDPFWIVLSSMSKTLINDFTFFQIIHAIIVNTIIFWFIKKYAMFRFTAVFLYLCGAYLYFNMEIMRESLAICVFLLAYPSFREKKWFNYYAMAIAAFLFHSSAIILFLFPLLRYVKMNLFNFIIIGLVFIVSVYFREIIDLVLFTSRISEKFNAYSNVQLNIFGIISNFLFYCLIPFVIVQLNNRLNRFESKFEELIFLYFFLAMVFLYIPGFARFLNYLTSFLFIYLGDFINSIMNSKKLRKVRFLYVLIVFVLISFSKIQYYLIDTSKSAKGTHQFNLWYPYSSVFEKEEYRYRELIFQNGLNSAE